MFLPQALAESWKLVTAWDLCPWCNSQPCPSSSLTSLPPPRYPPFFCLNRIWLSLAKPLYLFIFLFSLFPCFSPVVVVVVNPVTRKAANSNVLNSLTMVQACQVLEWLIRLYAVLVFLQQQGYKSESTVQTEAFFFFLSLGYFPHSLCVCACPVLFSREQAQIPIKEATNTAPAISATFYFLFLSQGWS